MVRFRGVATKYLDSYLGWRRMIDCDGDDLPAEHWLYAAVAQVGAASATGLRNTANSTFPLLWYIAPLDVIAHPRASA